ncbi:hypothetical protein NQD34_013887 [Periophthalmus magnuspinnatus]|nr:hypothetical protein NQD34_013887 [Periophthalmus magnuspinnatus]
MYLQEDSPAPVLILSPDSGQFFEYSSVNFSYEPHTEGWTVHRKPRTRDKCNQNMCQCGLDWGSVKSGFVCVVEDVKESASGIYWCGKNTRRSNSVELVVKNGVILQMPVLPVSPGQSVNLTCRHKTGSAHSARFYRDGHFCRSGLRENDLSAGGAV